MKNISLALALLPLMIINNFGQEFMIGPKGSLNFSRVQVDETFQIGENTIVINDGKNKFGFQAGIFSRFAHENIYLQPELYYTSSGGNIEVDSDMSVERLVNLKFDKLDLPVLGGLKFDNFRIEVGPVFSMLLKSEPNTIENVIDDIHLYYNVLSFNFQAGIGLDIGSLVLDLKYEGSLSKFGNEIKIGEETFVTSLRNPQVIFSVGINLISN